MTGDRIGKDRYYLNIAREVSRRGTCLRRNYGAVIVNQDQIISTGYTGAPRGVVNCIDLGVCRREQEQIPSGERYELCRSVHAEMNAVIHASRSETIGGTLYLVCVEAASGEWTDLAEPCLLCRRGIINAGLANVVSGYPDERIRRFKVTDWITQENRHGQAVSGPGR
ncbi:MAG: cytidine deaminase [Proteobacteria bacterium]|nr:cytidine deaminase [Pseudomonadota bacterium]